MSVLVAQQAPEFTAPAVMADGTINPEFKLSDLKGKYVVLFFWPMDFTFVCPSEIIAHNHRVSQLKERGVEIVGISIDSQFTPSGLAQHPPLKMAVSARLSSPWSPMSSMRSARRTALSILKPVSPCARPSSLIRNGMVQHQVVNNLPLGRNIDEMVRMIDALQFFEQYGEVCPAGWNKGDARYESFPARSCRIPERARRQTVKRLSPHPGNTKKNPAFLSGIFFA